MATALMLPHFGKVVTRHLCDEHLLEVLVQSQRNAIMYLCALDQCRDGAHMAAEGSLVEIVQIDDDARDGYPHYILPAKV